MWWQLGKIDKVVIGHDGAGEYPDWFLEEVSRYIVGNTMHTHVQYIYTYVHTYVYFIQVSITCCPTGEVWVFSCNKWLKAHQDLVLLHTHNIPPSKPLQDVCQNKCLCDSEGDNGDSDDKDRESEDQVGDCDGDNYTDGKYDDDFDVESSIEEIPEKEEDEHVQDESKSVSPCLYNGTLIVLRPLLHAPINPD